MAYVLVALLFFLSRSITVSDLLGRIAYPNITPSSEEHENEYDTFHFPCVVNEGEVGVGGSDEPSAEYVFVDEDSYSTLGLNAHQVPSPRTITTASTANLVAFEFKLSIFMAPTGT
jgi:hypothetical protein